MVVGYLEDRIVNGRILLIEGDGVLGAFVGEMLRHRGYEVVVMRTLIDEGERIGPRMYSVSAAILDIDTTSAREELDCLDGLLPYDEALPIVLMGLQLPEILCRQLRPHLVRMQTKCLAWVQKPFRNEELLAALQQAHKRHEHNVP